MSQPQEAMFFHGSQFRIDHTPGSAVAAGQVVLAGGGLVGVCTSPEGIAASTLGSIDIGPGSSYKFKKDETSGPTFAVGDLIGWDDTNNLAVAAADADSNAIIGICTKTAGASDDHVVGILNPALSALNLAGIADVTALTITALAGTANTTLQALPDPTDSPATADALRDDIVANLLPPLRNNLADIATQLNALIAAVKGS